MENVLIQFFNWMFENPTRGTLLSYGVITALCILLGFVLPARSARRKREKEQRWRDARTVKTLGFIRSAKHTGRSVNDNPEFRFVVDALAEDGTFFETTVTEIIPRRSFPCAPPERRSPSGMTRQTAPMPSGMIIRTPMC